MINAFLVSFLVMTCYHAEMQILNCAPYNYSGSCISKLRCCCLVYVRALVTGCCSRCMMQTVGLVVEVLRHFIYFSVLSKALFAI